ncbi:MAG: hypothetical protein ACRDTH_07715 [Pseudonocardiaceae bacterium]
MTSRSWYRQSTRDQDTHRGYVYRCRVHTLCGQQFTAYGRALTGKLRDPSQICPPCQQAYRAEQDAVAQRAAVDLP